MVVRGAGGKLYKPENFPGQLQDKFDSLSNLGEQQEDPPGLQGRVLAYQLVSLGQGQVQEQRQEAVQAQALLQEKVLQQVQVLPQVQEQLAGQRRQGLLVEGLLAVQPS